MATGEQVEHPWAALEPPPPPYVRGDEDVTRWRKAQTLAANSLDLPPNDPAVMATTRIIYHDRETYPD